MRDSRGRRGGLACVMVVTVIVSVALCSGALHARDIFYNESILLETVPRVEGSTGERQAIAFIIDELKRMGIEYQTEGFSHYTENFSNSRNIYAYITGTTDKTIVLAAALNRTASYSISLLLSIIEQYRLSQPDINLVFAFLGADYWQEQYIGIGSQLLSESLSSVVTDLLLYVNIDHDPEVLEIDIGTVDQFTRRDKIELIIDAAEGAKQQIDIPAFWRTTSGGGDVGLRSANAAAYSTPTDFFLQAGMQALTISAADSQRGDQPYTVIDVIGRFISLLPDSDLATDRNYLLLPLGGAFYVIGEQTIVYTLIILIALMLCAGYYSKGSLRKQYAPLVKRYLLLFILSIGALFSAVYSSQFVIESIFSLFPIINLWQYSSFLVVTLKIVVSISLYLAFSAMINRIHTTPISKTYSAFALILGATSQLVALVNLFLAIATAWLFLGTLCFVLAKEARYKAIIFRIALIVPACYLALYFISTPVDLHRTIIFSNVTHSFSLTIIILPYFFMYLRLRALGARVIKNTTAYAIITMYAAVVIGFFMLYDPFIATVPHDIKIVERIDQERMSHTVQYQSNIDKDTNTSIQFDTAGQYAVVTPRTTERIVEFPYQPVYDIEHLSEVLDGYDFHLLTINGKIGVQAMSITITSPQPLTIVETNTPYTSLTENTIQFHTGRSPTLPLGISFFIPNSSSYPLTAEITAVPNTPLVHTEVRVRTDRRTDRPYTLHTDSKIVVRYIVRS